MAVTLVQQAIATWASGNTLTATFGSAITNGNAITIIIGNTPSSVGVSSIARSGGSETYASGQRSNTNRNIDIWYALNISGAGTGVQVTWASNPNAGSNIYIQEWAGVATSSALDAKNPNNGNSANPATASITPTAGRAGVMIAGAYKPTALVSGPTNSFNEFTDPANDNTRGAYRLLSSFSGSYTVDWTVTASGTWDTAIITLLAPAAGGGLKRYEGGDGAGAAGGGFFQNALSFHRHPTISLEAYRREQARKHREFMAKVRRAA